MKVNEIELKQFITKTDITFTIPIYQRNYDWEVWRVKQLYEDILSITGSNDSHFIGCVCHQMPDRRTSVIIDGQQRITTIMLILKAIQNITDDEKVKKKITDDYIFNDELSEDEVDLKIKLKPIEKDNAVFKEIINSNNFDENNFSNRQRASTVFRNYKEIYFLVNKSLKKYSSREILDAIGRLKIVEMQLDTEQPQNIFERMNSTGQVLTPVDNIRNYLFMSSDYKTSERLYNDYWLKIENKLNERLDAFFFYYTICQLSKLDNYREYKKINKDNLYLLFKAVHPKITDENAEELFAELLKYSNLFNRLYETENCKSKVLSEKFNILIGILNENVSIPLILYLSMGTSYENRISTDDFLKCLDLLISYSVRTMICGTFSFKTLNVMNWISSLNNEQIITAEHLKKLLFNLSSKYSFPSDDMFEKSMREINLYHIQALKPRMLASRIQRQSNLCP